MVFLIHFEGLQMEFPWVKPVAGGLIYIVLEITDELRHPHMVGGDVDYHGTTRSPYSQQANYIGHNNLFNFLTLARQLSIALLTLEQPYPSPLTSAHNYKHFNRFDTIRDLREQRDAPPWHIVRLLGSGQAPLVPSHSLSFVRQAAFSTLLGIPSSNESLMSVVTWWKPFHFYSDWRTDGVHIRWIVPRLIAIARFSASFSVQLIVLRLIAIARFSAWFSS